jgi:hypothetical protein
MAAKPEYYLQVALTNRIRSQYPDVLFRSDLGGIRLTPGLAVQAKAIQQGRAWPDLFIAEPKVEPYGDSFRAYYGMYLEIKDENTVIWKKNGDPVADKHIREQIEMLKKLRDKGYYAEIGAGFDTCWTLIDRYLSLMPLVVLR